MQWHSAEWQRFYSLRLCYKGGTRPVCVSPLDGPLGLQPPQPISPRESVIKVTS